MKKTLILRTNHALSNLVRPPNHWSRLLVLPKRLLAFPNLLNLT